MLGVLLGEYLRQRRRQSRLRADVVRLLREEPGRIAATPKPKKARSNKRPSMVVHVEAGAQSLFFENYGKMTVKLVQIKDDESLKG